MSKDALLNQALAAALHKLEADQDILVCAASPRRVVERLSEAVLEVVPSTNLTASELNGLRLLVHQAIGNPTFFDWEKPTLTGFSAADFKAIAEKLPRE